MNAGQEKRLKQLQAEANKAATKYGQAIKALGLAEAKYKNAHHRALAYERECEASTEERRQSDENDARVAAAFAASVCTHPRKFYGNGYCPDCRFPAVRP